MTEAGLGRWMACATMAVAALFGAANPAAADTYDPGRPPVSMYAVVMPTATLLPGSPIARTEMITGTDSIVLPFVITGGMPAGSVTVTLADTGWPGLFSSLSFAATTSTSLLAELTAPGSVTFGVSGAGTYFATVYGIADPNFGSGVYSLNLKYSPVPLPAAAWLLASGLVLLRTRRRKETVINAR